MENLTIEESITSNKKEIGSYRLTLESAWESESELEYDSLYELCNGYNFHKWEKQYKTRAFIDYIDGSHFELSSYEVNKVLKLLGVH